MRTEEVTMSRYTCAPSDIIACKSAGSRAALRTIPLDTDAQARERHQCE